MNAPRLRYATSRIWDQVRPEGRTEPPAEDLRRRAWHGLGLVVLDPEDIHDELERQMVLNIAHRLYGRRGRR